MLLSKLVLKHYVQKFPYYSYVKIHHCHVEEEFSGCWEQGSQCGIVLCLEPTDKFFANDIRNSSYYGYKWIFKYINPYQGALSQMLLGLIAGSLLLLIFPFLTQAIVDYGIGSQNLKFIWQNFLFVSLIQKCSVM